MVEGFRSNVITTLQIRIKGQYMKFFPSRSVRFLVIVFTETPASGLWIWSRSNTHLHFWWDGRIPIFIPVACCVFSYGVQKRRLPVNGLVPKVYTGLRFWCKCHVRIFL